MSLLPRADRQVVDSVARLLAACTAGFSAALLDDIRDVLLEVIEFNTISVTLEDEASGTFQLKWRSAVGEEPASPISTGERREHAPHYVPFARPASATEPRIVSDGRASPVPLSQAVARTGLLSYVRLPIVHEERGLGWLVVAHRVPGAPSQAKIPLLVEIARVIAPAILRAEAIERRDVMAALLEAMPDGALALDAAGVVVEANRAALTLLGRDGSRVLGRRLRGLLDEPTFERVLRLLVRGAPTEKPTEIEIGGAPVDVTVTRISGMPDGSLLLGFHDARARQAAEEAADRRIEHAAFLRALGEAMAGAVLGDAALRRAVDICFVRFELGTVCGLRADGDSLRLVAPLGASDELAARLARITDDDLQELFGPSSIPARPRVLLRTGAELPGDPPGERPRWLMFVPLVHARRRLGGLFVAGHAGDAPAADLSDTWERIGNTISIALGATGDFERVVALEAENRQLVDNLPVVVARLDPRTGATLFVNAALHRVLGVPIDTVDAAGLEGLLSDDLERESSRSARARAAAGIATGWQDRRYRHADGRVLTLRECIYPVFSALGVRAVEIIAYDITTELDARKQLMQSDRLASLGALAAGVAHEINNPVAFISLATGQMNRLVDQARRREPGAHDALHDLAAEITEAAARIAEIVAELKLFTRIPEGASTCPVDINRMLQTAMTLTAAVVRRHARLDVHLAPLPLAPGNFAGLGHVFANLLVNAAQAIETKRDRGAERGEPDVVGVSSGLRDGAIVVRIRDTGVGIDDKVLPRIFDPFFKTEGSGQGAGLGLAIAYDMVRRVGGDIRVMREPVSGTAFEITLPLEPSLLEPDVPTTLRPGPATSERPAAQAPDRSLLPLRRVLIIDDERHLVRALARQLSERYDVDTALTAAEAIEQLNAHTYDAVVCDLRLPEQSGPAIYDEVVSRSPEQASRFIFTTGALEDDPDMRAEATGLPVLEKPFDGASFEALVDRVASRP